MNFSRHAPAAPERCAFSLLESFAIRHAAVVPADLQSAKHPGVERVVGRLERQHENGLFILPRNVGERFTRFEQSAVGRIEAGLGNIAHRVGAA